MVWISAVSRRLYLLLEGNGAVKSTLMNSITLVFLALMRYLVGGTCLLKKVSVDERSLKILAVVSKDLEWGRRQTFLLAKKIWRLPIVEVETASLKSITEEY